MELGLFLNFKRSFASQRIKCNYYLVLCFISILSLPVLSQSTLPTFEKLDAKLYSLAQNCPSELAYIQTNKDIYETIEDLWFKIYLLNAQYFTPSLLSQTLYLQLSNENTKRVAWQEKYEIKDGFADGHVFLQDSLIEGNYMLSAFTKHSFFADSNEFKAVRRIQIRKDMKHLSSLTVNGKNINAEKVRIQFNTFPEGGDLISGTQCNLAFKAVGKDGMPQEVQGTLYEDSVPLTWFRSIHAGMGSLTLIPYYGKNYYIRLTEPAIDSSFILPKVYPEGISMRLTARTKEFLEFAITASPGLREQPVYLQGQIRGVVYCSATALLRKRLTIKIPVNSFTCQGIAELTLFNDSLTPVAERLVYVNPNRKLYIETKLDKEHYETRGKASLKIKVADENGQPVVANLGVTVYDKFYQNSTNSENIFSHFYLFSQLKGKIYNPSFYFDTANINRQGALDLLLLTQGWRRYVWNEVTLKGYSKDKLPVIFDGVQGDVRATRKLKEAKGKAQMVEASNLGMNKKKDFILSDVNGSFMVTPKQLKLWQGGYVYLKPNAPEEFKPCITLSDPFQNINEILKRKDIIYPMIGLTIKKEEVPFDSIVDGHNTVKLSEVTVKAYGIKAYRDKYMGYLDSLAKLYFSTNDFVCHTNHGIDQILNCFSCLDPRDLKPIEGHKYLVRLDENGEILNADYKGNVFYGTKIIIYHNSNYNLTEEDLLKKFNLTRIKAYYAQREFYQPNYDTLAVDDLVPDFRNTLLWKPSVVTNEKGEATLEFFCSDINTRFVGNIEGVSKDGLLGSGNFEFFVLRRKAIKQDKYNKAF